VPRLSLLLAQFVVILVVARGVGWSFSRIGQPKVVGEMAAGILLGPSLLGWVAPGFSTRLFPPGSLGLLGLLSQIGLVLFMFQIGLELDTGALRRQGRVAFASAVASIAVPFGLGVALAFRLSTAPARTAGEFPGFALFLGTAMSVTAFPVLARILAETRLLASRVGAVAIACAAVNDVAAWCLLAAVLLLVRGTGRGATAWLIPPGLAGMVLLMYAAARPGLRALQRLHRRRRGLTPDLLALVLVLVAASAWLSDRLGLHALFGAFLLGACTPRDPGFQRAIEEKFEGATVLLLPLFFSLTGLRTSVRLLEGGRMWLECLLIVGVAVAGKFGAAALSARLAGMPWRESLALGGLMNTRGLMELVILGIGLDAGVIPPVLFSMMVIMALVTTCMTTPLLGWLDPERLRRHAAERAA